MQDVSYYFRPCMFLLHPILGYIICIQHHFTFLFCCRLVVFSIPKICFLPLKHHFFSTFLPMFAPCFLSNGKVYVSTFSAFLCFYPCIQHQNTLHLAPKNTAFSTKTHCIQQQNTLRLAPKYVAFSTKIHCIQHHNAQNLVLIAILCSVYSFSRHSHTTPFCIKTNLRENRFFTAGWTLGE